MKKLLLLLFIFVCTYLPGNNHSAEVQQRTLFQIKAGNGKGQVFYKFMEGGRPYAPRGLCSDGSNFYIGDIHNNRILVVDGKGGFLQEIKNEEFSDFAGIYCHADALWIKIFDHYYETASLIKYTLQGEFIFKTNSPFIGLFRQDIVDYYFSKDGIYAIHEDDTVEIVDADTGKAGKAVPSFWFDDTGYYRLAREKGDWSLYIYDRANGKLQKRVDLISKNNKTPLLRKINSKVYLENHGKDQPQHLLYHYNQNGKVDKKISKEIALAKHFDLKYSIGYSHPKADYIEIIQYYGYQSGR